SPETCWTLPVTFRANGNTCPLATLAGAGVAQVAVTLGKLRVTGIIKLLSAPGAVNVTVPVKGLCAAVSPVTSTATATGCDKPPPTGPVVGVSCSKGTVLVPVKFRDCPQAEVRDSVWGGGLSPTKALKVRAFGNACSSGPVATWSVVVVCGPRNGPREV